MNINKNDGLQKEELIKKLEEIQHLYNEVEFIKIKMDEFVPYDNYERKVTVPEFPGEYESSDEREQWKNRVDHTEDDAVEKMAQDYESYFCPQKPTKTDVGKRPEPETPLTNEYKKTKGFFPICAVFLTVCSLLSGGLFSNDLLTVVLNLAIIIASVAIVLLFFKKLNKLKLADEEVTKITITGYELEKTEAEKQYNQEVEEYKVLMESYKSSKDDFIHKYTEWRKMYLESIEEETEIEEKLENDRIAAIKKIEEEELEPALKELANTNDLIACEYLPVVYVIIDLIKSNRADSLKEAINLYEDILYRERQLELQREIEEQRQYEEEIRRQDEERRYQEEKKFREQQEWNRQQEAENRERENERRHREEMGLREKQERDRMNEERRQRDEERRRQEKAELNRKHDDDIAIRRQCNSCALVGRCSIAFTRSNCASYIPK